jgi:hypothetical protein
MADEWHPFIITAFTFPVLAILVALMPVVVRKWRKRK